MLMSPDQKSLSLQWMMVNAETHGSPRCWEEATAVGSTLNKAFVPSALRLKKHCPVKSWKMGWRAVKYHPLDFTQPLQPLTPNNCDHLQWSAQDWPFQPSVMEGRGFTGFIDELWATDRFWEGAHNWVPLCWGSPLGSKGQLHIRGLTESPG